MRIIASTLLLLVLTTIAADARPETCWRTNRQLIAALLAAVPARAADCTGRMRFGIRGAEYRGATDRSRRGTEAPRPSPCCRA
jgi:hypothetical protein